MTAIGIGINVEAIEVDKSVIERIKEIEERKKRERRERHQVDELPMPVVPYIDHQPDHAILQLQDDGCPHAD